MKLKQKQKDNGRDDTLFRIKQYQPINLAETLSFMLIRPPRFIYKEELLQLTRNLKDKFQYRTYQIPFPLSVYTPNDMKYIILYLHGNSSSRFEGYMQLANLPRGVGLACFDFNGCGLRQQSDFITLGKYQSFQVNKAAQFLKKLGYRVVGWGRSMGSVSLLMSQQCDIMIADSPFSSLSRLCKQSSINFLPKICCCFFHCFYPCVECWVRSKVHERTGMDPVELQIIEYVKKIPCHKSLLIMTGKQDMMIKSHHAQILYEQFKGDKKKLIIFEGSHNSTRPHEVLKQCFQFIHSSLGLSIDMMDYPPYQIKTPIRQKRLQPLPFRRRQSEQDNDRMQKSFEIHKINLNNKIIKKELESMNQIQMTVYSMQATEVHIKSTQFKNKHNSNRQICERQRIKEESKRENVKENVKEKEKLSKIGKQQSSQQQLFNQQQK